MAALVCTLCSGSGTICERQCKVLCLGLQLGHSYYANPLTDFWEYTEIVSSHAGFMLMYR